MRPSTGDAARAFFARLSHELLATVQQVDRLTPTIVEIVLKAPLAARKFQPGQFYRLQNFEALSPMAEFAGRRTRMQMEGLALTGAWVDRERGLVSTIVLEMGGSSDLCAMLQPGEPVILMGPTGAPTEIEPDETVVLVGGGLGNAVLFSIGAAFRAAGSKVLYFAGYKKVIDRYKVEEIEAAADVIVWCCDEGPGFAPGRPQDASFVGNIVQAMMAYAERRARHAGDPDERGRPHHRHRLRPHDGRGGPRPPRRAQAVSQGRALRHRLDQLADAVHDEGDLRAVPAAAARPGDGQGHLRLLLLQPGPAARLRRLRCAQRAPEAEHVQEKLTAAWLKACRPDLLKQRTLV